MDILVETENLIVSDTVTVDTNGAVADITGTGVMSLNDGAMQLGVTNAAGEVNGIRTDSTSATMTGGTGTTTWTLTDTGAGLNNSLNGDTFTVDNAGNTAISGTFDVAVATTLTTVTTSGLATFNSAQVDTTLNVDGATTLNGATTVNNTFAVTGATNINNSGAAATNMGTWTNSGAVSLVNIAGPSTLGSTDGTNTGTINVNSTEASMTVTNNLGNKHGLNVGTSQTQLSGGNHSTTLTLNDGGATFSNTSGTPVRVQGVADAVSRYDAVNLDQLGRGIAIANAMDVFLPREGETFRLSMGGGYYEGGATAVGMTGAGRVSNNVDLYFGVGSDTDFEDVGGKVGISIGW